jgi:hypothetical protein
MNMNMNMKVRPREKYDMQEIFHHNIVRTETCRNAKFPNYFSKSYHVSEANDLSKQFPKLREA